MSQRNLDLSNIGSVIQQMGREAVTQHSDGHLFAHADCLTRLSANHLDPGCAYVRTWPPSGKEPLPRRADGLPIESQDMQKLRRQKVYRSFSPFPGSTRMTMRAESMSLARSLTTSEVRNPDAYAVMRIAGS